MATYTINTKAVLFHPLFDEANAHSIPVFDVRTREVLRINAFGYAVLQAIAEHPGVDIDGIRSFLEKMYGKRDNSPIKRDDIKLFLQNMKEHAIVFETA